MSIESNKTDFEKALRAMEDAVSNWKCYVHPDFVDEFECVIDEYNIHFLPDIEELISTNAKLIDINAELEEKLNEFTEVMDCDKE